MPIAALKICRKTGCGKSHKNSNGYCDSHQDFACGWFRTSTKTTTQRGYGADWRKIRKQRLELDNYLCQPCKAKGIIRSASEVDHVINKANGGTDKLSNLQSICIPCHREKTKKERGGG